MKFDKEKGRTITAEEDNMPYPFLDEIIWLIENYNYNSISKIEKCENSIDKMEEVTTKYLVNLENQDISEKDNRKITGLLKVVAEYEKIGDESFRLTKKLEEINNYSSKNDLKLQRTLTSFIASLGQALIPTYKNITGTRKSTSL